MDNAKITSYLLGNNPGFEKVSRLEFFEYVEKIYGYNTEKLTFFWEQANKFEEEFYKLVFEKFYSQSKKDDLEKAKLDRLLKELNLLELIIPNDKFDYSRLLKEFESIEKRKTDINTSNSQKKGKQFEEFLKRLFNSIEGFEVTDIKQADDEQIDLVIKNNINKPFWLNLKTPVILGEAKNWSTNTNTEVINTLRGKLVGHANFVKIGFVVAMNGFTKVVESNLLRDGASERIIVAITGDDIKTLLESELNPIDWIEGLVMKSFI
ncbi:MAG: restriction endonuclease [Candidatus Gracilibacteria bacterium]|nr:restriction endonuclease [Candidatus Gracilibacteria bacterium]